MMSRTSRTSSARPTGSTIEDTCWLFDAPLPAFVARLMRTSHQPNGRQSSGCATLTAWMRPGGSVSFDVETRPKPIRMPSRVSAIVCTAASARTSGRCSRRAPITTGTVDQDARTHRDRDADDHRDDHHDEEHRRSGEQHRRDQASGVHLDDARRVHGGGGRAPARRARRHGPAARRSSRDGPSPRRPARRSEHEDALPGVVGCPRTQVTRAARWRRLPAWAISSFAVPKIRGTTGPRDVDALDPVEPRLAVAAEQHAPSGPRPRRRSRGTSASARTR